MNFRILAASVWPRGRVFALLAAAALTPVLLAADAQAQAQAPAPAPAAPAPAPKAKAAPKAAPKAPPAAPATSGGSARGWSAGGGRSAPGPAGPADLCALDQILPEGPGSECKTGLLHRQGWTHRVR